MKTRLEIQTMLEEVLGSSNVYFQEPPNTGMKYPCIVYSFAGYDIRRADNKPYKVTGRWEITHMYKSIKNDLKQKFVFEMDFCSFDRGLKTNGIYHDYYTLNS